MELKAEGRRGGGGGRSRWLRDDKTNPNVSHARGARIKEKRMAQEVQRFTAVTRQICMLKLPPMHVIKARL